MNKTQQRRLQRELAEDTALADSIVQTAREAYGSERVEYLLKQIYYIIPDDMIWVDCPKCRTQVPIDFIHEHIRRHRGSYINCAYAGCYDRRFKTHRGYLQHRRKAHPEPPFPGGKHA